MTKLPHKPIRVLQLCEHFGNRTASFHGVARSFELWLPCLNQGGEFYVVLCSRAVPNAAALERFQRVGISPLYLGYSRMDPRNLLRLISIIRREKIDILHLHGYGACTWGRIAGHLLGIPAIVHERCNYRTVPWFQRPVEFILGRMTRYAFAVSESTRQFTIHKRFIRPDVVKLLYSGIPLNDIPPADPIASKASRQKYGVPDSAFLIGVVSRIEPHKGHEDVFEAVARIKDRHPEVRIWIIGDGYYLPTLKIRAKQMGIAERVQFLGYQSNIWPLIRALDAQVFPSHQEGTPNTLYEALAIGGVIVASTADGQGEILAHEREALTYAPGDIEGLAAALSRVIQDAQLRERLRAAAVLRARDFDMRTTIETLKATYRLIMEKRR